MLVQELPRWTGGYKVAAEIRAKKKEAIQMMNGPKSREERPRRAATRIRCISHRTNITSHRTERSHSIVNGPCSDNRLWIWNRSLQCLETNKLKVFSRAFVPLLERSRGAGDRHHWKVLLDTAHKLANAGSRDVVAFSGQAQPTTRAAGC